MRQFINGEDGAFRDLEARAARNCIRFRGQEMPPGCEPSHADVGVQGGNDGETVRLFVSRGVRYSGSDESLARWFRAGELSFPDFRSMREWFDGTVAVAFRDMTDAPESSDDLTDMESIREELRTLDQPLFLEADTLADQLKKRVLGQETAIDGLVALMVRHLARRQPQRPAVAFAVGPSGVGKTRTAEAMAEVLRAEGNDRNGYQFLRLDMTEYQEAHRVSQLIGAPQGYIGYGEGSQLADALRANPRSIVLFDEIEKAHPSILRVLMNAMDAGRLATASGNGSGRQIDCRRAVFIFTSNLDANSILEELENRSGFGVRALEDEVCRRRLHAGGIAPEIVGRIARFLVYRPLAPETKAGIVALSIVEIAREYGLEVTKVSPEIVVAIMRQTRGEHFGVRPERYLIDDLLGDAFLSASREGLSGPLQISGDPPSCKPVASASPVETGEQENSEEEFPENEEIV